MIQVKHTQSGSTLPAGDNVVAAQPGHKRIAVVSLTIPFPPRDGVELPTARVIEHLASRAALDLIVLDASADTSSRIPNVPPSVRNVLLIPASRTRRITKWLGEFFSRTPAYLVLPDEALVMERLGASPSYDWVWISPVGGYGIVLVSQRLGIPFAEKIAIGLNDVTTTLYWETFRELFTGRSPRSMRRLLRGLRMLFVWLGERKYLRQVDLVHLQTSLEARRAARVLRGVRRRPRIAVAPNGYRTELLEVAYSVRPASANILFMTHLDEARRKESDWFLTKVWPRVRAKHPTATLHIAGTKPAPALQARLESEGIVVHGYVPDLVELYDDIDIAVVPTFHGTGLINRVVDALAAGVPLVSTTHALATIDRLTVGREAIAADTPEAFTEALSELILAPGKRRELAANARTLALGFPTWSDSLATIERAIDSAG